MESLVADSKPVQITVLDEGRLLEGGLDWKELATLGCVQSHRHTGLEEILKRAVGSRILLTNKTPLNRETLEALPDLEFISVLATGFNVVDVLAAGEMGIPVSNVPSYGSEAVAQHTWALILELCNHAGSEAHAVSRGTWTESGYWSHWTHPMVELNGRRLGILGRGAIARRVAEIGKAMGMNVVMASLSMPDGGGDLVSLEELRATSDVLSLHCRLDAQNKGLIDAGFLRKMKPTAFLINTARGGLVHESDLADALREGVIAGAGLDVLCDEPPLPGNPLPGLKNCIVTGHMAWSGLEARRRLVTTTAANIRAFLAGCPIHVVNAPDENPLRAR
jgi:glycerate dehydrogenase